MVCVSVESAAIRCNCGLGGICISYFAFGRVDGVEFESDSSTFIVAVSLDQIFTMVSVVVKCNR